MAKLETLLAAIADPKLRAQLTKEVKYLKERQRFGLVFERHFPETVIVGDTDPLKVGDHVRPKKDVDQDEDFQIVDLTAKTAKLLSLKTGEESSCPIKELLAIKRFGDPAYVGIESVGEVRRSNTRPAHAVINGENFHTLQLLSFIYERQVDCIYIDPPYNSGAADWKYNNDYVDASDSYRHSKWLSMMEKRLRIAKRLLKRDGVLIVTIDENEVNTLGLLLEELFPEYQRTMVTIVINPKGTGATNFARVEEYAYFVVPKSAGERIPRVPIGFGVPWEAKRDHRIVELPAAEIPENDAGSDDETANGSTFYRKLALRRDGAESSNRRDRPRQFYAIKIEEKSHAVVGIGPELRLNEELPAKSEDGVTLVYPIDPSGRHRVWRYGRDTMTRLIGQGEIRVGRYDKKKDAFSLYHWKPIDAAEAETRKPRTVWWHSTHDAGAHGANLLNQMFGERSVFPFPKSLYAVRDCLELVVGDRPDALILDFFGGSGTTTHATWLLNKADGGNRRCVLVTNNEVSRKQAEALNKKGLYRTDAEFERHGIYEAATKPRLSTALTGKRPDGSRIPHEKRFSYLDGSFFGDGFEENVEFFRLDYLDGDKVEIGHEFDAIHPLLWLAAGAKGKRPKRKKTDRFLITAENGYAVLFDDAEFREFEEALAETDEITHVYLVTDSDEAFAEMRAHLDPGLKTVQLYREFLRRFRRRARL
jgi:adenine-specific DNA-methyltransferase